MHISGDIYLQNLKYDETVVKFQQDWGAVTSLTFRADGRFTYLTSTSTLTLTSISTSTLTSTSSLTSTSTLT